MKIIDITTNYYQIPLKRTLEDSVHGEMKNFELVTVEIQTDTGTTGLGVTYTAGTCGNAIRAVIDIELKPILLNKDPMQSEGLWKQMWWRTHYTGRGGIAIFALSAIDIALWDIKGKALKMPLWKLLGGTNHPQFPKVLTLET